MEQSGCRKKDVDRKRNRPTQKGQQQNRRNTLDETGQVTENGGRALQRMQ